jgi:hypothetical protein
VDLFKGSRHRFSLGSINRRRQCQTPGRIVQCAIRAARLGNSSPAAWSKPFARAAIPAARLWKALLDDVEESPSIERSLILSLVT